MPDEPVEFRAAKSGLSVADWLSARLRNDAAVCTGAAVLMIGCGVGATLCLFGFFWVVFACGGIRPWWLGAMVAAAIVTSFFLVQRKLDGDHTEPIEIDAGTRGTMTLRLSRLTGNSWLMFLDRSSGDLNPVVRVVTNLVLLAPRLIDVGRRMWKRSRRLKSMDLAAFAAGLDALMQSGGRVPIGDLVQEFPNYEPQRFVGDLTEFDGVILLASDPPGLTLAPSVAEEFEAWKKEVRKKRRAAGR